MLKKFLATASVVGLIAGAASALEVDAVVSGADAAGEPLVLAEELDYAGGSVASTNQLAVSFYPTGGVFPSGNVVAFVAVEGATFDGALDGTEVITPAGTSVISSGGADGGSTAVFLLSDVSDCGTAPDDCTITIPLILDGSDVSMSVGLETDAGVAVDNSSEILTVSADLVVVAPAFDIAFVPNGGPNAAELNNLFTSLTDGDLGDISVNVSTVEVGLFDRTVNSDLAGTDVDFADIGELNITVSGIMDAFDPADGGEVFVDGFGDPDVAVDVAADEATVDLVDAGTGAFGDYEVFVSEDSTSAIARSPYTADVELVLGGGLEGTVTASGSLQSITREGASVLFPWTQTQTQGSGSGVSSVYRIGNLDGDDTGAVFVEVLNASQAGYTNPGITEIAASIDGGGELVLNSSGIEAALGNYGRGDLEFSIEADPTALTGRQFVVRNGNLQQVIGGNLDQDVNN